MVKHRKRDSVSFKWKSDPFSYFLNIMPSTAAVCVVSAKEQMPDLLEEHFARSCSRSKNRQLIITAALKKSTCIRRMIPNAANGGTNTTMMTVHGPFIRFNSTLQLQLLMQRPGSENNRVLSWLFSAEPCKKRSTRTKSKCFSVLAAEKGFEPLQTESESVVLPLHHSAMCKAEAANSFMRYIFQESA